MAPVSQRWDDQAIEVFEDLFHRFALGWRRGWKLRFEIAGFDRCEDWAMFDVIEVIGDPIDQIVAEATKVGGAHVAQLGRERLGLWVFHGGNNLTELFRARVSGGARLMQPLCKTRGHTIYCRLYLDAESSEFA